MKYHIVQPAMPGSRSSCSRTQRCECSSFSGGGQCGGTVTLSAAASDCGPAASARASSRVQAPSSRHDVRSTNKFELSKRESAFCSAVRDVLEVHEPTHVRFAEAVRPGTS